MRRTVTVEKCPCGHQSCRRWVLNGVGHFYQGTGFTEAQAHRIADLINADPTFPFEEHDR